MKKEIIQTGKTIDAAIEQACAELGLPRDKVDFEIIDLPKKGFLGLKSYPAKVRVFSTEEDPAPALKAEKPAPKAATPKAPRNEPRPAAPVQTAPRSESQAPQAPAPVPVAEQTGDTAAKEATAVAYIKEILLAMGAQHFEIQSVKEGDTLNITLTGDDLGFVIGRRGETIDAIQYLTGLAINRMEGDYLRITIDSGNFREKREKTLESLARRLARNAVKTGRSVTLEPMNPYERRIIHATVATVEGATSSSVGEEPNRRVVISSLTPRKSSGGYRGQRKPYNRDAKGGRDNRRGGDRPYHKNNPREPRHDRHVAPAQEYTPDNTTVTEVLPKDAESKPLYSKIEL